LILDLPGKPVVGNNPFNMSFTVSDSPIVCNDSMPVCDASVLGANVTDGGKLRYYKNRTLAGASENWPPFDAFNRPCCAYPYSPPHS